jgi:glutamate carboxypeptidase
VEERICQWIADHRDDLFACLEVLVNTDSNSHDKAGVDRVGEIMAGHLRRIGCHVERHAREKVGDCLVATLPGGKAGRIMLSGHMDTALPVGDAQRRPFKIEGKRAYGPGVADMKGGLTTMLFAMEALHTICPDEMMDMAAVLTGDEEIGSFASHDLLRNEGEKATAVFCMESGRANGAIVSARRGFGFYELEVFGRSAHAGVDPENGLSAIDELARKVVALQDLNDLERGIAVNVNHIKGGAPGLTIPDYAWASLSAGFYNMTDGEQVMARVAEIAAKTFLPGTHTVLHGGQAFWPMEKDEKVQKLLAEVQKAGQVIGLEVEDIRTGGCADSGLTWYVGAPSICAMGPVGGRLHTEQEYMEIDTMVERCQLLALSMYNVSRYW